MTLGLLFYVLETDFSRFEAGTNKTDNVRFQLLLQMRDVTLVHVERSQGRWHNVILNPLLVYRILRV